MEEQLLVRTSQERQWWRTRRTDEYGRDIPMSERVKAALSREIPEELRINHGVDSREVRMFKEAATWIVAYSQSEHYVAQENLSGVIYKAAVFKVGSFQLSHMYKSTGEFLFVLEFRDANKIIEIAFEDDKLTSEDLQRRDLISYFLGLYGKLLRDRDIQGYVRGGRDPLDVGILSPKIKSKPVIIC